MILYLLRRLGLVKNSPNAVRRSGGGDDTNGQDWQRNNCASSSVPDSDGDSANLLPALISSGDAPDVCNAPSSDASDSSSYSCSDSGSSCSDSSSSSSD